MILEMNLEPVMEYAKRYTHWLYLKKSRDGHGGHDRANLEGGIG